MAEWITPKIDWTNESYFNVEDYNRIKNNINYLKDLAYSLYISFAFTPMGADKAYTDFPYASEFNAFEDNLEGIKKNTYPFYTTNKKTYYDNQVFATSSDLNRIESACLKLYAGLTIQKSNKKKLALRLGNMKGVVV